MRHPERLFYARSIYVPRRQPAILLHAIGKACEGLLALVLIIGLALGSTYIFGMVLGFGARLGYELLGGLL